MPGSLLMLLWCWGFHLDIKGITGLGTVSSESEGITLCLLQWWGSALLLTSLAKIPHSIGVSSGIPSSGPPEQGSLNQSAWALPRCFQRLPLPCCRHCLWTSLDPVHNIIYIYHKKWPFPSHRVGVGIDGPIVPHSWQMGLSIILTTTIYLFIYLFSFA